MLLFEGKLNLSIAIMLNVSHKMALNSSNREHFLLPRMALGRHFVTINKSCGFMLVTKVIL